MLQLRRFSVFISEMIYFKICHTRIKVSHVLPSLKEKMNKYCMEPGWWNTKLTIPNEKAASGSICKTCTGNEEEKKCHQLKKK